MKRFALSLLLAFTLCGVAAAQDHKQTMPGFPFQFPQMGIQELMDKTGVTEDQIKQIHNLFGSQRTVLAEQTEAVQKQEAALTAVLGQPQVDWTQAKNVMENLLEARKNLGRSTTGMMLQIRQLVTYDQWQKLIVVMHPPPSAESKKPTPHEEEN